MPPAKDSTVPEWYEERETIHQALEQVVAHVEQRERRIGQALGELVG